jgi:hypothetical protein
MCGCQIGSKCPIMGAIQDQFNSALSVMGLLELVERTGDGILGEEVEHERGPKLAARSVCWNAAARWSEI